MAVIEMTDVHSKEIRSYNMSRIKAKDTKPEEYVRKYLFSRGFRYRKNYKRLPGHPDIVLPKFKTVIFVNGCYWHMHENCRYFVMPKTNEDYWTLKLYRNKERDREIYYKLRKLGWKVIIVWECELKRSTRVHRMELLCNEIINP